MPVPLSTANAMTAALQAALQTIGALPEPVNVSPHDYTPSVACAELGWLMDRINESAQPLPIEEPDDATYDAIRQRADIACEERRMDAGEAV